jgi:hypothetical protein
VVALARIVGLGALALTTCLPEGGPGIGARWLEGRGVGTLLSPRIEVPGDFMVFARADHDTSGDRFSPSFEILALGAPGGPAVQLARGIDGNANTRVNALEALEVDRAYTRIVVWDLGNRLWGLRAGPAPYSPEALELLRMDLATGSAMALGRATQVEMAPDGKTLVVGRPQARADVYDLEDHVQPLGAGVSPVTFVGSSLFYSDTAGMHQLALPPLQPPQLVVPRARLFTPVPGRDAEELFLVDVTITNGAETDPIPVRQIGLLRGKDATPTFKVLAQGRFLEAALSDEGDRVALLDRTDSPDEVRVRIIDLQSGAETTTSFVPRAPDPLPPGAGGPTPGPRGDLQLRAVFRPRHPELWIFQSGEPAAVASGAALVSLPRSGRQNARDSGFGYSLVDRREIFTSDGRFWIFNDLDQRVHLGNAADPLAPPVLNLTEATRKSILFQEIDDGHTLLIYSDHGTRTLHRVDLDAQRMVQLGHDVGQVLVGRTRAIAIVDKLSGLRAPGHLVSLDLATGEATHLADNVVDFRLLPVCPTCDPTAPGVGLQYVVQARLPYRHDGLWKATLP